MLVFCKLFDGARGRRIDPDPPRDGARRAREVQVSDLRDVVLRHDAMTVSYPCSCAFPNTVQPELPSDLIPPARKSNSSLCVLCVFALCCVLCCGVCAVWCVVWCVLCGTMKTPCVHPKRARVYVQKTSPCVPAPHAHVETHVRVVPVHTGTF